VRHASLHTSRTKTSRISMTGIADANFLSRCSFGVKSCNKWQKASGFRHGLSSTLLIRVITL
jgi:hypothetical protein